MLFDAYIFPSWKVYVIIPCKRLFPGLIVSEKILSKMNRFRAGFSHTILGKEKPEQTQ